MGPQCHRCGHLQNLPVRTCLDNVCFFSSCAIDVLFAGYGVCWVRRRRWLQDGSYVDDITIILVHLPRLLFDMATDLPPARSTARRHSHSLIKAQEIPNFEPRYTSTEVAAVSARHAR